MGLAKNIVKYRKQNDLSQEQLASALSISRQSISKWETGENLPSIDNLISLSGMLDISLDELITGEPYLHFPFNYGKPKNKWPLLIIVFIMLLVAIIQSTLFGRTVLLTVINAIGGAVLGYILVAWFSPFDFKRYYTYWSLEKSGLNYPTDNEDVYGGFKSIILPIEGIFHLGSRNFLSYKDIKSIEVIVNLLGYNPSKELSFNGGGGGSRMSTHTMENFYLKITTKDNEEVYLNLNAYYWKDTNERKILTTILTFLKRKNFEFIDPQDVATLVRDNKNVVETLYDRRDKRVESNG